jgi:hypothetical protein
MRMFKRGYCRSAITPVRASGLIGTSQYVVFEDGVVVIETPKGVRRYDDLQELVSRKLDRGERKRGTETMVSWPEQFQKPLAKQHLQHRIDLLAEPTKTAWSDAYSESQETQWF